MLRGAEFEEMPVAHGHARSGEKSQTSEKCVGDFDEDLKEMEELCLGAQEEQKGNIMAARKTGA